MIVETLHYFFAQHSTLYCMVEDSFSKHPYMSIRNDSGISSGIDHHGDDASFLPLHKILTLEWISPPCQLHIIIVQ